MLLLAALGLGCSDPGESLPSDGGLHADGGLEDGGALDGGALVDAGGDAGLATLDGGAHDGGSTDGGPGANDAGSDAGEADAGPGPCEPRSVETQLDVPYADRGDPASDAMTRLDIHPPSTAGCDRPIAIWVHGGGWRRGDKGNNVADKIALFHELGWVFISINYRLSVEGADVRHPDHVEDVAAAFAWVVSHARELGGDPRRVALLGHSAGAHLVALAATNARFLAVHGLEPRDVSCVGSYDTRYDVSDFAEDDPDVQAIFTDDPLVWADASPAEHVEGELPPFQLACRGAPNRIDQCEAFAADLRARSEARPRSSTPPPSTTPK